MNIPDSYLEGIIKNALAEDLGVGDITTGCIMAGAQKPIKGMFIAKAEGVIAGLPVLEKVFKILDGSIAVNRKVEEGGWVSISQVIATIEGPASPVLWGERTALNFLQRMSGIATRTRRCVETVSGYSVRIADTRKTAPGLRILDKYSVAIGGGSNHRFNLSDGVLIKDNHIKAAGGIAEAVARVRERAPHTLRIEIEVEDLQQLDEALEAGAEVIMLDNMSLEDMKKAVIKAKGKALLEASGNVTEERLRDIAATGVDIISMGALTHSVKALDISLKFE
ncbi:MAG: Quinolinate phosphoribosyltransferase [decarboxylating] [Firmicutes bacterium]|nr:Quinolinate phosphoribosyltransferase [decarboxylating] [Bacillota bacterium]MDI6704900.1 carboxylating nicotinate-nucleotide diphosphorylase [Bacillota bacterium]